MRFTRYERLEPFAWTGRKLAMAQSKAARQNKKLKRRYPLIASVLPVAAQFDFDEESNRRQLAAASFTANRRAFHARVWRESRGDYFRASETQRADIRSAWAAWTGPTTSTYFRYVVDLCTGVVALRSEAAKARERDIRAVRASSRAAQGQLDLSVDFGDACALAVDGGEGHPEVGSVYRSSPQ